MRRAFVIITAYILIILIIPFFAVKGWRAENRDLLDGYDSTTAVIARPLTADKYKDKNVKVLFSNSGEVRDVPVFDYLCGVVAAEMPANYEKEALKAQSVAAFSYMVYRMEGEKSHPGLIAEHKGAYVCTDYTHCKGYLSKDEAIKKWGEDWYDKYWGNIENAVSETLGEVLVYDSKPINAVFHSLSSGITESAEDVWGVNIPYLVGVDSSGDKNSSSYSSEVAVSEKDFSAKILGENNSAVLTDEPSKWIGEIVRTSAGGVKTIIIGGITFKGEDIRNLFTLKSTNFEVNFKDGVFTFKTKGYGHGVGMSQYGANTFAKEGKKYDEILKYYYTNTQIVEYQWE